MDARISQVKEALNGLADAVQAGGSPHGTKTMREIWGWNFPSLNAKQIGSVASLLASKLDNVSDEKLNSKFSPAGVLERIADFQANTLPYFWNGNGSAAAPLYFALLHWIDLVFEPVYVFDTDWEKLAEEGSLPKKITNKLRSYNTRISRFDLDFESLRDKISYIEQAHDAAEALPTDLETLRAANDEVAEKRAAVERQKILAEAAHDEVTSLVAEIKKSRDEARKLVENTEDAYSAATTRGLGEAFQTRADRSAKSMWTWVAGLLLALSLGAIIGHFKVVALQEAIVKNSGSGAVSFNLLLAFISVAAPVWFAWIATKQIGHRFRLSEDYAFKASVAQAYEGYRREAARLDEKFAKRLFSSALDRIDEAPIRFVENESYGSPIHEFFRVLALKAGSQGRSSPTQTQEKKSDSSDVVST